MPYTNKIQTYVQLAGQTAAGLTKNLGNWTGFLTTASRLYKYPFSDQLLIHAQNPNSTAIADFNIWTKRMRRYVRRGSKGMALVHVNNGYPQLQYVFDVSDTGVRSNSCSLILWQYKDEYREVVTKALEECFGVSCGNGLPDQLEDIAAKFAKDYWDDYHSQIMYELAGSPLEGMDEINIGKEFRDVAGVSTAYVLLSRCGLHPEQRFRLEDFQYLCDFNTQKLIQILGIAVNQASSQILHHIAVVIFQYERQKQAAQQSNVSGAEDNKTSASGTSKEKPDSQKQKPSVQEVYMHYKPVIRDFLLSDTAYQNACKNSGLQNAKLEGEAAVKRAANSVSDLRFLKFFYDLCDFHNQILHEVFAETYPALSSIQEHEPEPAVTEAIQDDIPTDSQQSVIKEPCAESNATPGMAEEEPAEPPIEHVPSKVDSLSDGQQPVAIPEPDNKRQEIIFEPPGIEVLSPVENFIITDDNPGSGGPKEKFQKNMAAIAALKQIETENRHATPEEQQVLSQYVGWGGIP